MTDNLTVLRQSANLAVMRLQHAQDRLQAELQFAGLLCDLHPGEAKAWRALLAKAASRAEAAFATGDIARAQTAVARAEELLAPIAAVAKSYTIYCVGHGHIDMNWMWSWPETVAVTHDTFATVLKLMDEFPQFRFSQSQASVYAIIEEFNPEMLARIADRVREGRWEVTASHWVENDNNLAGPESLCRHLLYTRQYMQQLFGLTAEDVPINWSPDTFGHAITMPTYLARGGVKYLYLHRPGAVGPTRPPLFWWQGPDGSRVLVRNDMLAGYNGVLRPDDLLRQLRAFAGPTGLRDLMFVYGVGDHGGGPTRRDIVAGIEMDAWPVFPNIKFATTREYFERVEATAAELPTLDRELNFEFTGCYTSESLIKRNNRFAENRLTDAELAASLGWLAQGRAYPADRLRQGWRDTLFCHFHDILPGSGVHDTRTYADGLYQQTMATTSMIETLAYRGLAGQIDTTFAGNPAGPEVPSLRLSNGLGAGGGFRSANGAISQSEQSSGSGVRPFVVFNPLAWPRDEVIETTIWDNTPAVSLLPPLSKRAFSVRLPDGRSFAPQVIETGRFWGHEFVRLALPVQAAGLGYTAFAICEETEAASAGEPGVWQLGERQPQPRSHAEQYREGLENALVRVELDMTTGGIRSLVDKRTGVALISPDRPAPVLEYAVERPHGMTAWTIENTGPVSHGEVLSIKRQISGPFKASIEVKLRVHDSNVTLTYEVAAGDPQLHLRVDAEWFERGTPQTGVPVLRMAFPLALTGAQGRYEIPFGAIGRDLNAGQEVPALQWAQVMGLANGSGAPAGCLLVNDSKYGYSLDGSTLRMTLIRSSYDPDNLPEVRSHEIHAGLRPLAADLPGVEAIRLGRNFNHALRVVGTDVHAGALPAAAAFIGATPDTAILSSVKKAEAEDALILTFFDPTGDAATVSIHFDEKLLGRPVAATEVDLMERPLARSTAAVVGDAVTANLPYRGIVSIKVGWDRHRPAAD
ncbi:MAG: alpha-mannosidase [Chloroflexi bacterium]|nr:alpha-mannosidase [Chloroflexota bacterium]